MKKCIVNLEGSEQNDEKRLLATKKAITVVPTFSLIFRSKLFFPVTVFYSLGDGLSWDDPLTPHLTVISTIWNLNRDGVISQLTNRSSYLKELGVLLWLHTIFIWFHTINPNLMADNIRRGLQNINLGADEPPIPLPVNVVNEVAAGNRFILIGRPVMPRRQNIRCIIATLPRNWGHVGVYGRMIEGRQFQFVFPSEESLEMVMRRSPWAFADRMLIIERWTPSFNPLMLNFIPFWIQIRGIPVQFMSQDIVMHIGREMGMYLDVDYHSDEAARREYARVRVNWNVDEPLWFQRNFQFTSGVNTLLRFTYERLRGFCEVCGRLTHDSGACLIQNGGVNYDGDDEESDDENGGGPDAPPGGVIIEEIHEEEANGGEADMVEDVQEQVAVTDATNEEPTESDNDEAWDDQAMHTIHSEELNTEEMFNPFNPFGTHSVNREVLKRKAWMEEAEENKSMFRRFEKGETSGTSSKRMKEAAGLQGRVEDEEASDETTTPVRGAVGPKPPQPP